MNCVVVTSILLTQIDHYRTTKPKEKEDFHLAFMTNDIVQNILLEQEVLLS
jgi:hypothetical protein